MTDKCLGKRMMVIGQLSESELAQFNSDEEMEKFIIKKMGKTRWQNCENAFKSF